MIDTTMTSRTMCPPPAAKQFRRRFRDRLLAGCFALALMLSVLLPALAPSPAGAQEDEVKRDARLEGYSGNVSVENQSTALIWLLFAFLGVVALGALFKDAKRTHLD